MTVSLAMGAAAFVLVTLALIAFAFYAGVVYSDQDWKKQYMTLYKTALLEIAKAKGLAVGDIESYLPKSPKKSKSRPTLSLVKDKGDGDET